MVDWICVILFRRLLSSTASSSLSNLFKLEWIARPKTTLPILLRFCRRGCISSEASISPSPDFCAAVLRAESAVASDAVTEALAADSTALPFAAGLEGVVLV